MPLQAQSIIIQKRFNCGPSQILFLFLIWNQITLKRILLEAGQTAFKDIRWYSYFCFYFHFYFYLYFYLYFHFHFFHFFCFILIFYSLTTRIFTFKGLLKVLRYLIQKLWRSLNIFTFPWNALDPNIKVKYKNHDRGKFIQKLLVNEIQTFITIHLTTTHIFPLHNFINYLYLFNIKS